VRADCTLSFIGLKLGLFTGAGREQAGAVYFDDLAVPASVYEGLAPLAERLVEAELRAWMPRRARDAHKGMAGHVLVVGGGPGMAGAAHLAGEAAYRAGAGLVSLAMHPAHATRFPAGRPELIVHAVDGATALRRLIARVDAIALGPGLGRDDWARTLCGCVLEARQPLVVDADALSLLGADGAHREDWVLTPHPGEAARLIGGLSAQDIQADRLTAVRAVAAKFGGTCVLKGAGTLISTHREGPVYLCDRGNPGMASGGMGDALTGVIAALIAQGLAPGAAARLGVWLHASAADAAAARGERGLLASDVLPRLRTILDGLARR
jgi:NAD(P)H-hydrate epimerase